MGSSFVRTGNVAAGGSPAGKSDYSIRKRAVGGGWVGGLVECGSTGIVCLH